MNRETTGFFAAGIVLAFFLSLIAFEPVPIACGSHCEMTVREKPYFFPLSILIVWLYLFAPQKTQRPKRDDIVFLWRRIVAVWIDVFFLLQALLLFLELGVFLLSVFVTGGDVTAPEMARTGPIITCVALLLIASLYVLLYLPAKRGRSSLGEYLMGYQTVPVDDTPRYALRPFLGHFAMTSFPYWVWFDRISSIEGRYWWDRIAGTKPVRTDTAG